MLPVTSSVAALAAVALVVLSVRVSLARMRTGVRIGAGEDEVLMRRIRAQGNFIEYVPLALILLGLVEARGAGASWLWTIAGLLVAGRALHAAGILGDSTALRGAGMLGTHGALLLGAAALAFG